MKIFDTLSKTQKKLDKTKVNVYMCGPTIYDDIHIGNARPIILSDTLIRFLEYKNIEVNFLQNITDIDDKIIQKAIKQNTSETEITKKYKKAYFDILEKINIRNPNSIISISDHIEMIQTFIDSLIHIHSEYNIEGDVYFHINKYEGEYGKLSKNTISDLIAGNRIEVLANKQFALDFSLWKATTVGINWEFVNAQGRPGWHTECVALINDYFGSETIDLHIGGIDLQFPHHENERIQFIALHKKELANIWMHNGHLTVDNIKMSKSLNNTIYLKDFLKTYSNNMLKWIFLNSYYRQPLNITEHVIQQADKFQEKIRNTLKKIKHKYLKNNWKTTNKLDDEEILLFEDHMQNDLNTPLVITQIERIISDLNNLNDLEKINKKFNALATILNVLGFEFDLNMNFAEKVKKMFIKHQNLIAEKKYLEADEIRMQLIKEGIY